MNPTATMIVTRHPALAEWLVENGYATPSTPVLAHASAEDVRGKVVAGVLPLHLAAEAEAVLVADLDLPAELRGKELSLAQVCRYVRGVSIYRVWREKA